MEIWKTINISSLTMYEISNYGNIRNIKNKRPLKIKSPKNGYCCITLCAKSYKIHRLVALTFLLNPNNKPTVNHIDKNKHNNKLENLEWATYSEQKFHSKNKDINNNRKIWKIDIDSNKKIQLFNSLKEAGLSFKNNNAYKNISLCANGKIETAYSFKWEYQNEKKLDNEIWKSSLINNKLYFISNLGRIKNKNRILKPTTDNNGYLSFNNNLIHILVAKSFVDNPNKKQIINHKDGNKTNNNYLNLEWVTTSENVIHAINNGLRKNVNKVCHVDDMGNIINIYNSCMDASRNLDVNSRSINKCCKGELLSCGINKYKFKFLDKEVKIVSEKIKKTKSSKKIDIFNNDGKFIETLNTIVAVCKKYGVNNKTVVSHCDNKTKYSNLIYCFKYHI